MRFEVQAPGRDQIVHAGVENFEQLTQTAGHQALRLPLVSRQLNPFDRLSFGSWETFVKWSFIFVRHRGRH